MKLNIEIDCTPE